MLISIGNTTFKRAYLSLSLSHLARVGESIFHAVARNFDAMPARQGQRKNLMGARFGDERWRLHRPRLGAVLDTRRPVLGLNLRDLESPEREENRPSSAGVVRWSALSVPLAGGFQIRLTSAAIVLIRIKRSFQRDQLRAYPQSSAACS